MSQPHMMVFGGKGGRDRRRPGRPALYSERATKRIEIVVTADQRRELERVASETGKNVATVIREAVNEYVSDFGEKRLFPE